MVFYEQEQMQYFVFRFSSGAAERHIPKCADILSNKNKPINHPTRQTQLSRPNQQRKPTKPIQQRKPTIQQTKSKNPGVKHPRN